MEWARSREAVSSLGSLGRAAGPASSVAGQRVNRAVSNDKARRLLGFEPVSLEWGLDRTVAELSERGLLGRHANG